MNLTTNALRHTPSGGRVTLAARRLAAEVEVTVTDTGPGVPANLLARVFDPYVRGPGSGAGPSDDGSGLGLAIVRRIAELHGGRATAASGEGGRGTAVELHLPG